MKYGDGMQTLTLSSCSHIFDQKCIRSKFHEMKPIDSVSCPLCKTSANICMPLINDKESIEKFIDRMKLFVSVISVIIGERNLY